MKKFLKKIIIFIIGLVITNLLFYFSISNSLLFKPYLKDKAKISNYRNFILADSHGGAITNDLIKDSSLYNLSYGSDSYIDMYYKLLFLIKNVKKIDTIFITADDHTLSVNREITNNTYRSIYYVEKVPSNIPIEFKIQYYSNKYLLNYLPLIELDNSKLFYDYLVAQIKQIKILKKKTIIKVNAKTWKDLSKEAQFAKCMMRMEEHFQGAKLSEKLVYYLNNIVDLCVKENITLVGVKYPLPDLYIKTIKEKRFKADSILLANNLKVLNYKNLFIKNDEYFANQDHLNRKGAIVFAEVFREKNNLTIF